MKIVEASEGRFLTQRTVSNERERVFAVKLYLAQNDDAANWREAEPDEYDAWLEHQGQSEDEIDKTDTNDTHD